jgi:YesN/AraC family two-component response regulator
MLDRKIDLMEPLKIIIAEDNPKDYEFLERLLAEEELALEPERADNGLEALKIAARYDEPLVISDIQMPEMNGVDFARALWDKRPMARIVFWSQYKDEMYVRALLRIVPPETVYGYVLKSRAARVTARPLCPTSNTKPCSISPWG